MGIKILEGRVPLESYNFDGPHLEASQFGNCPGVFVILGRNGDDNDSDVVDDEGNAWNVVDAGESGNIEHSVDTHPRKACWKKQNYNQLNVAALCMDSGHADKSSRVSIEEQIRNEYKPPCGDR